MTNDSHSPQPGAPRSAATQRLLDAFERHRTAERNERRRAERLMDSGVPAAAAVQQARDVRRRSPYLRLWDDMDHLYAPLFASAAAATPSGVAIPVSAAHPGLTVARPNRTSWRSRRMAIPVTRHALLRAAAILIGLCITRYAVTVYDAYADSIHARPATITYVNAPISTVVAELRRRTALDIRACNVVPGKDRVTLTLRDIAIDSVLRDIGKQDEMIVHWRWLMPKTVLLQPRPNLAEGATLGDVFRLWALSYTTIGCRP